MQLSFLEFPPLCLVSELGQTDSGFRNLIWIICPGPMASASCQLFCPSLVPWPCWQTFFVSVRRQPMIAEVNPMPCHLTLTNISIYFCVRLWKMCSICLNPSEEWHSALLVLIKIWRHSAFQGGKCLWMLDQSGIFVCIKI